MTGREQGLQRKFKFRNKEAASVSLPPSITYSLNQSKFAPNWHIALLRVFCFLIKYKGVIYEPPRPSNPFTMYHWFSIPGTVTNWFPWDQYQTSNYWANMEYDLSLWAPFIAGFFLKPLRNKSFLCFMCREEVRVAFGIHSPRPSRVRNKPFLWTMSLWPKYTALKCVLSYRPLVTRTNNDKNPKH